MTPQMLPFRIVDVFTSSAYAGNPLAVVFDGEALSTGAMQAVAREFNFSETTFVCPPSPEGAAGGATYRLRIFTPSVELPFAGHPSVGSAWAARAVGIVPADTEELVQECGAGLLRLRFAGSDPQAEIRLGGAEPTFAEPVDPGALLTSVGLGPADGDGLRDTPPRWCGAGLEFGFLRVRADALVRAVPDLRRIAALGGAGLAVFAWDPTTRTARTRVFAAGAGVAEDPATGSAGVGFGVWLAAAGLVPGDGETDYTIHQGVEMGRPSLLRGTVTCRDGRAVATSIAGSVAPVAEGRILPPAS